MITAKFPIMPIWQNIGESTYRITNQIAQKYGEKATHTGVLDPMAEGVVIVLLGDERFKKHENTSWLKEYEFSVVFGISTDTYDGLGLVTKTDFSHIPSRESLEKILKTFLGEYEQKVPVYSARKVAGKKLFTYAQAGNEVELPTKSGIINEIQLLDYETKNLNEVLARVIKNIEKVTVGEFRQDKIIEQWKNFENKQVVQATIKVTITRGMYVRSLSQDIAEKLNSCAFVTKLIRTKNGIYGKEQCDKLLKL